MALDIAALQLMYGANMTTRTGDDAYALPDANRSGTSYLCLWDAGGTDRIEGAHDLANLIDLRPATLAAGPGGGGWRLLGRRHPWRLHHRQGRGDRERQGRHGGRPPRAATSAANEPPGLGGDDALKGGGRGRTSSTAAAATTGCGGGGGDDRLRGGTGADRLSGNAGADAFVFAARDSGPEDARPHRWASHRGEDVIDLSAIDANHDAAGEQHLHLDAGRRLRGGRDPPGGRRPRPPPRDQPRRRRGGRDVDLGRGPTHRLGLSDFDL